MGPRGSIRSSSPPLRGIHVVVAGAGLAGLAAARDLERDGADVTVVEARGRLGGRVHTIRDGLAAKQHAEAGADLIESEQTMVRELTSELGLQTSRILKQGWGFYGEDGSGRRRVRRVPDAFEQAARLLGPEIRDYRLAGRRWDSAVAGVLGRTSVADWLDGIGADTALRAAMRGLRGFFLADPEDLSLAVLVDQFSTDGAPGSDRMFRIRGGNDGLPRAIAARLRTPPRLASVLRRVQREDDGIFLSIEDRVGVHELRARYAVIALPATTLRDVVFEPPLPEHQWAAIGRLRYGAATRMVLQFATPFWRRRGRRRAYGTDLPIGAVWDGSEDQRGTAGILTLLAGGRASGALQQIVRDEGEHGVLQRIGWLGKPSRLLASRVITWERDEWAGGGYAVFDPQFDPALRQWLARPAGRIVFAGEHTSDKWQGYMNGAIESGRRAAAEVRALARAGGSGR